MQYGATKKVPWGISESAYNVRDLELTYQYSNFGIPGLGSYTIEAIQSQDFAIVRAMVFIGSVLYLVGLILTDIAYTIADPRVRLA